MMYRIFPLEVVVSVATDTLFADHDAVKRLCRYIVQQPIPRGLLASVITRYCQPEMLRQFPAFYEIEITDIDFRDTKPFLTSLRVQHGSTLKVYPLKSIPKLSFL